MTTLQDPIPVLEAMLGEISSALPPGVLVSVAGPSVRPPGLWTARIGGHRAVAETPLEAMKRVEQDWRECRMDGREWTHRANMGAALEAVDVR